MATRPRRRTRSAGASSRSSSSRAVARRGLTSVQLANLDHLDYILHARSHVDSAPPKVNSRLVENVYIPFKDPKRQESMKVLADRLITAPAKVACEPPKSFGKKVLTQATRSRRDTGIELREKLAYVDRLLRPEGKVDTSMPRSMATEHERQSRRAAARSKDYSRTKGTLATQKHVENILSAKSKVDHGENNPDHQRLLKKKSVRLAPQQETHVEARRSMLAHVDRIISATKSIDNSPPIVREFRSSHVGDGSLLETPDGGFSYLQRRKAMWNHVNHILDVRPAVDTSEPISRVNRRKRAKSAPVAPNRSLLKSKKVKAGTTKNSKPVVRQTVASREGLILHDRHRRLLDETEELLEAASIVQANEAGPELEAAYALLRSPPGEFANGTSEGSDEEESPFAAGPSAPEYLNAVEAAITTSGPSTATASTASGRRSGGNGSRSKTRKKVKRIGHKHMNPSEEAEMREHLRRIEHMHRRINEIGSRADKSKNPHDPEEHPVLLFRQGRYRPPVLRHEYDDVTNPVTGRPLEYEEQAVVDEAEPLDLTQDLGLSFGSPPASPPRSRRRRSVESGRRTSRAQLDPLEERSVDDVLQEEARPMSKEEVDALCDDVYSALDEAIAAAGLSDDPAALEQLFRGYEGLVPRKRLKKIVRVLARKHDLCISV